MDRKILAVAIVSLMLVLAGCGEELSPKEVYDNGLVQMEQLETASLSRTQTLRAQQESFRTSMDVDVQFSPLEMYGTIEMTLLNLKDPLLFFLYVDDDEWLTKPDRDGADWEANPREQLQDLVLEEPASLLNVFKPFQNEFLMKDVEMVYTEGEEEVDLLEEDVEVEEVAVDESEEVSISAYEVSFRGSDEKYKPLVRQHLEQMNLTDLQGVDLNAVMETVEIERIDMTAQIEKETFDVHRFQTRFRYLVEVLDEYRVIDESVIIRLNNHNEQIDFEQIRAAQ
ncbi:DUF6612 family protein [Halalkalibacter kiskunsagensis]|uniref:DUF6612 family protein n=1 Tax=Halalkalibacter kiskunsagensis TaxID=1548599 RepID=A0ABV6KAM4_9BACI